MGKITLTTAQKDVVESIILHNGTLRKHVKPSGSQCYRLVDAQLNPVRNVTTQVAEDLHQLSVLDKNCGVMTLNRAMLPNIHGYFTFR